MTLLLYHRDLNELFLSSFIIILPTLVSVRMLYQYLVYFYNKEIHLSAIVCKNRPKWNLLILNFTNFTILTILTSNSESKPFFKYLAAKIRIKQNPILPLLSAQRCSRLKNLFKKSFFKYFFVLYPFKPYIFGQVSSRQTRKKNFGR